MLPERRPVVPLSVLAACAILFGQSTLGAEPTKLREYRDIVFASTPERELVVDLFVPTDVANPPLAVYIHGGGWRSGTHKTVPVKWIADNGFALASIEYRRSQEAKFPAQIFDCKGAIRWLRANARQYGYDASRIAVVGTSAGGQLAALLGTTAGVGELEGDIGGNLDQDSSVQAIVDYFGATDFLLRAETQPQKTERPGSVAHDLFGGSVAEKPELARQASAAFFVSKDDPPLLTIHGSADPTVLINQSERIVAAYGEQDLDAALSVVPDATHSDARFFAGDVKRAVLDFLKKHFPNSNG
jgi:acetyl esterase/lipase